MNERMNKIIKTWAVSYNIKELFESIVFCALITLIAVIYCYLTPDQLAGESDWNYYQEGGNQ